MTDLDVIKNNLDGAIMYIKLRLKDSCPNHKLERDLEALEHFKRALEETLLGLN